jgi:hypothetical protein
MKKTYVTGCSIGQSELGEILADRPRTGGDALIRVTVPVYKSYVEESTKLVQTFF